MVFRFGRKRCGPGRASEDLGEDVCVCVCACCCVWWMSNPGWCVDSIEIIGVGAHEQGLERGNVRVLLLVVGV